MSSFSCCIPWSVRWSPSWESSWRLALRLSTPKAGCWENCSSGVVAASCFNPASISLAFLLQLLMNLTLLRAPSKQFTSRGRIPDAMILALWLAFQMLSSRYRLRWRMMLGSSWGMWFVPTWMGMVLKSKTTPDRAIICSTIFNTFVADVWDECVKFV